MATYIVLLNWTEQGVAESGDSPSRANAAATALRKLGGKMKQVWWTMGPYDAVSIIEAPDDETVTAFCLAVGGAGQRTHRHDAGVRQDRDAEGARPLEVSRPSRSALTGTGAAVRRRRHP